MRARATAVSWLAEKTGQAGARHAAQGAAESRHSSNRWPSSRNWMSVLVDKMGQDAPALTDLNRPLKDHLQSLETPAAAAKPAASADGTAPGGRTGG